MAIIIPSKNIYDLSNPKVRDNVYNKVEVNAQKGVADYKYDITVAQFNFDSSDAVFGQWNEDYAFNTAWLGLNYGSVYALAGIRTAVNNTNLRYHVSEFIKNAYISRLKTDMTDGVSPVVVNATCRKYVGEATVSVKTIYQDGDDVVSNEILGKTIVYPKDYEIVTTRLDGRLAYDESFTQGVYFASVSIDVSTTDNITTMPTITAIDGGWSVEFNEILCGLEKYYATDNWKGTLPKIDTIVAVAEKYEPISVEITFQGNTVGIDFEKETISIGKQTSKNALSIAENELIQSTNIYYLPFKHYYNGTHEVIELEKTYSQRVKVQYIYNGTKGEQYIAAGGKSLIIYNPTPVPFEVVSVTFVSGEIFEFYKNILDEYNNGKETATLTCTMSQYLDTDGEVVIDADAYNLVDLNYFTGQDFEFDKNTNTAKVSSGKQLDGLHIFCVIGSSMQGSIMTYEDGRIYIKDQFTRSAKVRLELDLYDVEGDEDNYILSIDTSYLPQGFYTLSFDLIVSDGYVMFANLQINRGKVKPYQKHLKMHFSEGDIVIPMKYTSSGTDVGISLYNNDINTPKQFKVTGVELFYDGVTRQKLTLQEI